MTMQIGRNKIRSNTVFKELPCYMFENGERGNNAIRLESLPVDIDKANEVPLLSLLCKQ